MTRRKLTQEEIDLWRKVTAQTDRMRPESTDAPRSTLPKPKPAKNASPQLRDFRVGQRVESKPLRHDLIGELKDRLASAQINMDVKAYKRMKRGKLKPEGRLDLHGLTLDRAHPALNRFILSAQADGKRLVLVITGKGRKSADDGPIPTRRGVLKHQVPQWLMMPPLAQAVIQVSPAHLTHGGDGAYYVYLRRSR